MSKGSLILLPEPRLLSQSTHPKAICGKIVFQDTGPWCQKGWGALDSANNPSGRKAGMDCPILQMRK